VAALDDLHVEFGLELADARRQRRLRDVASLGPRPKWRSSANALR